MTVATDATLLVDCLIATRNKGMIAEEATNYFVGIV